jgi:aryl-alcohol dehydrogenase-like predicted oxidoreductase
MDRRDFLKAGTVVAGLAASGAAGDARAADDRPPIPKRRLGKTGVDLSIIALGGIVVTDTTPEFASKIVGEAFDRGINYFDVAPSYGNAQTRLGPALEPYRKRVFLACKTGERTKEGAVRELEESLRLLRTDHVDLYQFHHLTTLEEVDRVFGPGGAMEAFQAAKQAGKVRFLGFSAHSVEAALAAMDRFAFDTILFPINFVLTSQAKFGPQVLERAREKGMGILALKGMAKTSWPRRPGRHAQPKCWYQPADLPDEAALALRWTLSQPITAAVPPGDEAYFRRAMDVAQSFEPIRPDEAKALLTRAEGVEPIFRLGHA